LVTVAQWRLVIEGRSLELYYCIRVGDELLPVQGGLGVCGGRVMPGI